MLYIQKEFQISHQRFTDQEFFDGVTDVSLLRLQSRDLHPHRLQLLPHAHLQGGHMTGQLEHLSPCSPDMFTHDVTSV